jgi:predicted nucleic acid-binding Zn ribbon protein
MIMLDLNGYAPVRVCRRCHTPFIYPDKRAGFCSDRCRWADQKAAQRNKKRTGE